MISFVGLSENWDDEVQQNMEAFYMRMHKVVSPFSLGSSIAASWT